MKYKHVTYFFGIVLMVSTLSQSSCATFVQYTPDARFSQVEMKWYVSKFNDYNSQPTVAFYEMMSRRWIWGPFNRRFSARGHTNLYRIKCQPHQYVCFAAWDNKRMWGCGRNCSRVLTLCCFKCQEGKYTVAMTEKVTVCNKMD